MNSMSNPPLLEPLIFSVPQVSIFFFSNVVFSLISLGFAFYLFRLNKSLLARPAYYCALGWLFLYQIPVSIFSSEFIVTLENPWKWAIMIHAMSLSLLGWCALSSGKSSFTGHSLVFRFPELSFSERWFPVGLLLLMVAIYFYAVPYYCTGLYAWWVEPWMTLLARELSVKLIGSSLATYALGAAANIISPLVVSLSIFYARALYLKKKYIYFFMWLGVGFLAVILVLTSGAKGLLIPTFIMAVIVSLLWGNSWTFRVGMLIAAIGLVSSTMVLFELVRYRKAVATAGPGYDFAQCAVETNTCAQSLALVESLGYRNGSLGLSIEVIKKVGNRLSDMCSIRDVKQHPTGDASFQSSVILGQPVAANQDERIDQPVPVGQAVLVNHTDSAYGFFQAILNRAFVIPFQVGAWHLMYSETEPVAGWKTLPFARRLLGESLNMPELVYQKYGTIYSKGDRTSTSTAPTSFLLSYPSYLGLSGFLIAFGCLIVWDAIYAFFSFRIRREFFPIAAGIAAITSMNFMSSDFMTVLISHGGVAGLLIIAAYGFLPKFGDLRNSSRVDG